MAKYRISQSAKEDLIRIHQYGTQRFGALQADSYFDAFFKAFERIAARPLAFEAVDHIKMGYRRCVCGVDTIYYTIQNEGVAIMAIVGKQDLSNYQKS